jgi:hypothetical protein
MNNVTWRYWTICIVALLWNAFGAMDYVLTRTRNETYMSQFTAEQLEYFYNFPTWVGFTWAIGVWGAVLGSILLLLRKTWAVWAFAASLAGIVCTALYNFVLSNGLEIMGGGIALGFTVAVFVIGIALLWFSRTMQQRSVLT